MGKRSGSAGQDGAVLRTLETYYDAAPRPNATTEECGPFTVFVKHPGNPWPFYARPRLGLTADEAAAISADDVTAVRERLRTLGVPETLEWVDATTPGLLPAARTAGLGVEECPLLVLRTLTTPPAPTDVEVRLMAAHDPLLAVVGAAVHAGFAQTDEVGDPDRAVRAESIERGLVVIVGAFDAAGPVGGGSHGPRGATTELAGIAVLPRARRRGLGAAITAALVHDARSAGVTTIFLSAQDDAVARVYERVGFERVGTACIANARQ